MRGILDFSGENGRDSTADRGNIDINKDYFIEFGENDNNQKETNIELRTKSDFYSSSPQ